MSINTVPDDILIIIMNFIPTNKSSLNFLKTCKYIKDLFYKNSFVKHIKIGPHDILYDFTLRCCKHKNTLNTISITNVRDPQHWIFIWPQTVFFNSCTTKDVLDPPVETNTEVLYILNDRSKLININWSKFPKLNRFVTTNWNFNFDSVKNINIINVLNPN